MDENEVQDFLKKHVTWLGQSAIRFATNSGKIVYIDPFRAPRNAPRADYLFLTHPHWDHYNPKTVRALIKEGTRIIAPQEMSAFATDALPVGAEKRIDELRVKTYPAYNRRGFPHPRTKNWVGYLIEFDGFTLYHGGDTDSAAEIAGMKPDAALLPISGFMAFGIDQGAQAARAVGARVTVPIHYGLIPGTARNGEKFLKAYDGQTLLFEDAFKKENVEKWELNLDFLPRAK
jgi:L-ascorbate metabolism protein UlaG (beta-lactamase superfamily)